jgi:hypothetical protein
MASASSYSSEPTLERPYIRPSVGMASVAMLDTNQPAVRNRTMPLGLYNPDLPRHRPAVTRFVGSFPATVANSVTKLGEILRSGPLGALVTGVLSRVLDVLREAGATSGSPVAIISVTDGAAPPGASRRGRQSCQGGCAPAPGQNRVDQVDIAGSECKRSVVHGAEICVIPTRFHHTGPPSFNSLPGSEASAG